MIQIDRIRNAEAHRRAGIERLAEGRCFRQRDNAQKYERVESADAYVGD